MVSSSKFFHPSVKICLTVGRAAPLGWPSPSSSLSARHRSEHIGISERRPIGSPSTSITDRSMMKPRLHRRFDRPLFRVASLKNSRLGGMSSEHGCQVTADPMTHKESFAPVALRQWAGRQVGGTCQPLTAKRSARENKTESRLQIPGFILQHNAGIP